MKILALEFSSLKRTVAVCTPALEAVATHTTPGRGTHAFALIEEALASARIPREEIECIAVGLGPGSYTGIRVAISVAQGWQLARNVKLLGVSSLETIIESARLAGLTGRVTCVIDAQRREFYVAAYEIAPDAILVVEPLHIESAAQVVARAARRETIVGPEESVAGNLAMFPDALLLAKLASKRTDFAQGETLHPIYLRETSFIKAPPPRFSAVLA